MNEIANKEKFGDAMVMETPEPPPPAATAALPLTPEKVTFIEEKAKELFTYVVDSLDLAHKEATNILQWHFAAIIGGLGLTGTLYSAGYAALACGPLLTSIFAAVAAWNLIPAMDSVETQPPGNTVAALRTLLDEPEFRMRWRELQGIDDRIAANNAAVLRVTKAVDCARRELALLPVAFVLGAAAAMIVQAFCIGFD